MKSPLLWAFCLVASLLVVGCSSVVTDHSPRTLVEARVSNPAPAGVYVTRSEPDYPRYAELKALQLNPHPSGTPLAAKLEALWRTPIIDNSAYHAGHVPAVSRNEFLGPFLRCTQWNIEKSLQMRSAITAMESEDAYRAMIDPKRAAPGSALEQKMLRQRARLAASDIILLEEMDVGVPRSGYLDAAGEMARALGMNYAFATQYIELDPDQMDRAKSAEEKSAYKGLFGSALLSRYPIRSVELLPLDHQPYDWWDGEIAEHGPLESTRRFGSEVVFKNEIRRELKVGGRNFFRVDLAVPGLPNDTLTVVIIHLEIKCEPKERRKQIQEILARIKDIDHHVIIGGDFNSAPSDISQTSVLKVTKKSLKNPSTYLSLLTDVALAFGGLINEGRWVLNTTKNFHSPLAANIPIIAANPVRPLFQDIRDFRFADGGAFDWRGDKERSINGRGSLLSNSNEKDVKGQMPSFSVRRPIGPVGKYRLDWLFVKTLLTDSTQKDAPYRLAPHFGETMREFNQNLREHISDHRPIVIDIPLTEPPMGASSPEEPTGMMSEPVSTK